MTDPPASNGQTEARPRKPRDKPKVQAVRGQADSANIAAQMALAHRGLGSWAAVARLCGNHPRTGRPHSAAAAWFYGTGSRPIPDEVAEAWCANVTSSMLKSWAPRQRRPRACIEVSPETAARLRERKLDGETWDETLTRLLAQGE